MENKVKYARLSLLVIMIIYFSLGILAIISEFNINTNDNSIAKFSFLALIKVAWWPILIVLLMLVAYILYLKKPKYAAIIQIITGAILIFNTVRNVIEYGTTPLALILSVILPGILIWQGITILLNKKKLTTDEKLEKLKKEDEIKIKEKKVSRKARR